MVAHAKFYSVKTTLKLCSLITSQEESTETEIIIKKQKNQEYNG